MNRKVKKVKVFRPSTKLPEINLPRSLYEAEAKIRRLDMSLERSIHEHAYRYGVYFAWIKTKVGHGNFQDWVKDHTRWTYRTVRRYIKFADDCEASKMLLPYRPSESDSKSDIMSFLEAPGSLPIQEEEKGTPELDKKLVEGDKNDPPKEWSVTDAIEQVVRTFQKVTWLHQQKEAAEVWVGVQDKINDILRRDDVDLIRESLREQIEWRSRRHGSVPIVVEK